MAPLADASIASRHAFVSEHVEPCATVFIDGWQGYRGLDKSATTTTGAASGPPVPVERIPGELLPAVHRGRLAGQAVAAGHPTKARWTTRICP